MLHVALDDPQRFRYRQPRGQGNEPVGGRDRVVDRLCRGSGLSGMILSSNNKSFLNVPPGVILFRVPGAQQGRQCLMRASPLMPMQPHLGYLQIAVVGRTRIFSAGLKFFWRGKQNWSSMCLKVLRRYLIWTRNQNPRQSPSRSQSRNPQRSRSRSKRLDAEGTRGNSRPRVIQSPPDSPAAASPSREILIALSPSNNRVHRACCAGREHTISRT